MALCGSNNCTARRCQPSKDGSVSRRRPRNLTTVIRTFELSKVCFCLLYINITQGAKKILFTACHSGKLELAFTTQTSFQLAPKAFCPAELISQFFFYSNCSKNITCPSSKLKTELTSPITKSTSPGLSDITFFARCNVKVHFYV